MSHLAPSIQNSVLQIHTNFILIPTNLQLISLHGHFSSHYIFIHMLQSLPITYHTLIQEATPFFNFKSGVMTLVLASANICQQTRAGQHTRTSSKSITKPTNFSSHQKIIINTSQQKKIMKHSQDHSELIFLKKPPSHYKKHQNQISNLELTCTMTIDLKFLSELSPTLSPNLEDLEPKLKTL